MAIDSERKRRSICNFSQAMVLVLPYPDGTISQGDREQMAKDYWGLWAGAETGRAPKNARQWGHLNQSHRRFVMKSASFNNRSGD